ncbi:unnamed protein product, partial [marine sediment metagenome]
PAGYVICDGGNSIPNLLTRFVQGVATAGTNPGTTGGSTSKSHVSHTHTMGTHRHDAHSYIRLANLTSGSTEVIFSSTSATAHSLEDPGDTNSRTVTAHSDIRPLFYDIAYLMKT